MEDKNTVVTGKNPVTSAPASKSAEQTTKNAPAAVQQETKNAPVAPVETKNATVETKNAPVEAKVEIADSPLINFQEALDILATSKSRSSGGAKIRPGVGYTLVADKLGVLKGTSVPEQEQVIVKILLKALTTQKPVISEPELNKLVVAAYESGALKTKQDAWHIFRYYRTDLIKRGVLKQVDYAAA